MEKLKNIPSLRFSEFNVNWNNRKIKEILSIGSGRDYKNLGVGDVPVFGTGGLMTKVDSYLNDGETVCIGRKGTIDKPMYFNGKIWTVDTLFFTHSFKESDPKFVYYLFQRVNWKKHNEAGGVPSLSKSTIEQISLNIPNLPEQQKIASFLSAVDEKIQQLSRKKELLEQYKKGLMQQLFSGKLRFKDENGKDYPDWEERKLGDICTNISYGMNAAATSYDGQNKYLRITDIDESSDGLNIEKLTSPNGLLEDKFRVKEGDLLFARTGASVGKTYLYRNSDGILYFAGFLIRFHVKVATPAFVYFQTQSTKYYKWVKVMSMRSGQPGINAEEYKIFNISFPCHEEQQKIANFLSSVDAKIESTNQQIKQTQSFKKGLLQQMFV